MTIWRMRIACWINKATNTCSECVILIAFPRQQWLHERASMLCHTSCFVLHVSAIHIDRQAPPVALFFLCLMMANMYGRNM